MVEPGIHTDRKEITICWDISNGATVCEKCHAIANEASKLIQKIKEIKPWMNIS